MKIRPQLRRVVHDEGGFTLVELLTAMSILLIVIGSLTILMVSATKSETDLTLRVRAQQETRLALERIRHEIHRACKAEHMNLATGLAVTPAGAHSNVRLTPAVSSACPASTDPATAITWCMQSVATNRWTLRRVVGTPTSCTGGRPEADYITTDAVFTLQLTSGSLAKVKVYFPVDLDPGRAGRSYRLEDNLVLRNSTRAP